VPDAETTELLSEPAPLEGALATAWRGLAEARANPFLTPEWNRAALAAAPEEEPFTILWRRGGELCGVLPLVRVRRGPFHLLRFAGARRGDWFTPLCAAADEAAMAAACAGLLRERRGAWHQIVLDRVDVDCAWPEALWAEGVERAVAPAAPRRGDVLPYVAFGEDGYQGYLAARSRNFRSQLGRRRRKLEGEHGLSFRMTGGAEDLEPDLDTFFSLHDERWDERGGSSSGAPEARQLQRDFAAMARDRGWLRLYVAEADGAPRAAWYGWRIGERCCYALSGLAKEYEEFALGTVLLAYTIEAAANEGAAIYDLMWGDEGYKTRFETGRREARSFVLGRRGHPLRGVLAVRTALERRARSARGE
jgi:CelD/BcsL family acetyltransferase involved in cellulose biosynthesis